MIFAVKAPWAHLSKMAVNVAGVEMRNLILCRALLKKDNYSLSENTQHLHTALSLEAKN
jgi:hypothetical protein